MGNMTSGELMRRLSISAEQNGLSFEEWVKRKQAEKRLKKKLIIMAKQDVFNDMVNKAQSLHVLKEERNKQMEDWLSKKKF